MDDRQTKLIKKQEHIIYTLANFLRSNKLYLKGGRGRTPVTVEILDYKEIKVFLPINHDISKHLILCSKEVNGYIEVEFKYTDRLSFVSYIVEPVVMSVTMNDRFTNRFIMQKDKVYASDFRLIDSKVLLSASNISVHAKRLFKVYEDILMQSYTKANVSLYDKSYKDEAIGLVYLYKKILFVQNSEDISYFLQSVASNSKDAAVLIDKSDFVDTGLIDNLDKLLFDEQAKALLYYPIVTDFSLYRQDNIAYIKLSFDDTDIQLVAIIGHLNAVAYELTEKLKEDIMYDYKVRQSIVDLSVGGVKILVNDATLNEYFKANEEVAFNVSFSDDELANLPFKGSVTYRQEIDANSSYIGVVFTGGRKGGFNVLEDYLNVL